MSSDAQSTRAFLADVFRFENKRAPRNESELFEWAIGEWNVIKQSMPGHEGHAIVEGLVGSPRKYPGLKQLSEAGGA